jgi:membrane-associated protease RseP (regulator of RpoE activity)
MKTKHHIIFALGLTTALALPVGAIEAPSDDAPPPPPAAEAPPVLEAAPAAPAADKPEKEERPELAAEKPELAYLGVVSQNIPEILAEHIGLDADVGVVVESVMPDGPAANAGIVANDVITHVGGKPITSVFDLSREVQTHKPGDEVKVSVIQKGKPAEIDVKFGVRPDDLAMANPKPLDQLNLEGIPQELADRVRDAIQGNLEMQFDFKHRGIELGELNAEMQEEMKDIRKRMQDAMQGVQGIQGLEGAIPGGNIHIQQGATIRLLDDKGSVELKSNDGGKEVTLRDKDNNITWAGPWDTDQDKAAAPDDVRERVERMNIDNRFNGNGLRMRMGGAVLPGVRE